MPEREYLACSGPNSRRELRCPPESDGKGHARMLPVSKTDGDNHWARKGSWGLQHLRTAKVQFIGRMRTCTIHPSRSSSCSPNGTAVAT